MTGRELAYIAEAHSCGHLAGDGPFTRRSHAWLEQQTGCRKALLTPSCTAALEMMALLLDIEEGDEVILPSYTFVNRPGMSGDSSSWKGWGHVRWFIEEVPAGAA
ncbi:DegT/DnrJ/EryC1/StrS family aminotransferase [Mycobacterium tuberculosis]|uniref:DegT/DnrJ/EryC1/StrS family aminotransferase n=1 Tax=Mycobacterium tuberculosis TaxID=1773 RepID=UPI00202A346E|nr:DegT/DnrJ/EryC1/StrS family aminotransferase [Mycobacterium tuberculosis]